MSREAWDEEQEKSGAGSTSYNVKTVEKEMSSRPWLPIGGF